MALLASEIDDFKDQIEGSEWTPEMAKLMEALQEKKQNASNEAKRSLYEALDRMFDMSDREISDFIANCLRDSRYPGHQLLKALTNLLEKTPS